MKKRVWWLCVLLIFVWVLWGWGQYSSDYGTTIRLQFSGRLTTAGSCQKLSNTHIRCEVPAETQGRLELQATVTPSTKQVTIAAVSRPSWASFVPASGLGTASSFCTFTPPAGSAGQTYRLIFRASVLGTLLQVDLTVTLEVSRGTIPAPEPVPSTGTSGPYGGVTDGSGRFSISIPWPSNTTIAGRLTECTKRVLPHHPLSVTLIPKRAGIGSMQDIGGVRVAARGYDEQVISQLRLSSSMDLWGRTSATVELGDVCLQSQQMPISPLGPMSGRTDSNARFTVSLPLPNTTLDGRLTECGQVPLPNQDFEVSLIPKADAVLSLDDIEGFAFVVPGYEEETVPIVSRFSLFDVTSAWVGDVCLEDIPEGIYLEPGIVDIGDEKCPCAEGESCEFTLPDEVKQAMDVIRKDIKLIEEALGKEDPVKKGVELALEPLQGDPEKQVVYGGAYWDVKKEEIRSKHGELIADVFERCHYFDREKGTATLKVTKADKVDWDGLYDSAIRHLRSQLTELSNQLKEWQNYVNDEKAKYKAHCGQAHSPCECFKMEVYIGQDMPIKEVLKSPRALEQGQAISDPFLKQIPRKTDGSVDSGKLGIPEEGTLKVPKGGWIAARAVGKLGPHRYSLDGTSTDCCWLDREFGAFVQILAVWPSSDKEEILKNNAPPQQTPSGDFVRKEWNSGLVELGAYHTYSWTPSGYKVRLFNLVAQLGKLTFSGLQATGPAGTVLKERREDWVLWIPREAGTGELLLVVNGTVCQTLPIRVENK